MAPTEFSLRLLGQPRSLLITRIDDLMRMNGGPAATGTSTVQVTAEDEAKSKRAVKIVQELITKAS